jgi:hypothetical protein
MQKWASFDMIRISELPPLLLTRSKDCIQQFIQDQPVHGVRGLHVFAPGSCLYSDLTLCYWPHWTQLASVLCCIDGVCKTNSSGMFMPRDIKPELKMYFWLHRKTNSVAISLQVNYTDWATATCWRNLVPTLVDRGVSRGQRGGSPTVINLSFLDRSRHFSFK